MRWMRRFQSSRRQAVPAQLALAGVTAIALFLSACTYTLTMQSLDGEKLGGRWRFAREGAMLVQVTARNGEILIGAFEPVTRRAFLESYQSMFGNGSIAADGPDLSEYGYMSGGLLGISATLVDVAYVKTYDKPAGESIETLKGPLLYWTASLQGDRRSGMHCFVISSSTTARGFGRCKAAWGQEYTVRM